MQWFLLAYSVFFFWTCCICNIEFSCSRLSHINRRCVNCPWKVFPCIYSVPLRRSYSHANCLCWSERHLSGALIKDSSFSYMNQPFSYLLEIATIRWNFLSLFMELMRLPLLIWFCCRCQYSLVLLPTMKLSDDIHSNGQFKGVTVIDIRLILFAIWKEWNFTNLSSLTTMSITLLFPLQCKVLSWLSSKF